MTALRRTEIHAQVVRHSARSQHEHAVVAKRSKGAAESARGFAAEKMPYRDGVAAVIAPDMGGDALAVPDSPSFPTGDFTIEANILARTVDRTATVRTIAAKWSGENAKPGPQVDRINSAPEGGPTTLRSE